MTENIQIGFNIHPRWAAGSTLETFLAPLKAAGLSRWNLHWKGMTRIGKHLSSSWMKVLPKGTTYVFMRRFEHPIPWQGSRGTIETPLLLYTGRCWRLHSRGPCARVTRQPWCSIRRIPITQNVLHFMRTRCLFWNGRCKSSII